MDKEKFEAACRSAIGRDYPRSSVGLLSEKTLHAALKLYYEPDLSFHEQKIGPYFADICKEGSIIEIQTASFGRLSEKLSFFLPDYRVTVVYPIPATKYLSWISAENGEILSRRKVGKKGSYYDAGRELYRLLPLLPHENLQIHLLLIDMEELRLQDGWGKGGKRGAHRIERIPKALVGELVLHTKESFAALLPKSLPSPFTVKELRGATKTGPRVCSALLSLLIKMGTVEKTGQKGRAYLYSVLPSVEEKNEKIPL
ncbi:MAG: hypothetical protein J6K61_00080 [Clostridia bacterium]|nr:hypothetical protein [Clostridia bacterium]